MYDSFLLYSMFIVSVLITFIITLAYLVDAFVCVFGKKIDCKIISYSILPLGREFYLGQWHSIVITYEFEVSSVIYRSNLLNSTNSVMKLNYKSANKKLFEYIDESKVYVIESFPRISMIMPFSQDSRYYLGLLFSILCVIFSGCKIL